MLKTRAVSAFWTLLSILALMSCRISPGNVPPNPGATQSAAGPGCASPVQVGYRIARFNGVKAAVWYPSATAESTFAYSKDISSSLAKDGAPLVECGSFPLIVFSHGLTGCGDQSIFFTETLARAGYVVVAPDHQDALLCHVDGTNSALSFDTASPILDPQTWNDSSYQDRKDDIEKVLDGVFQDSQLNRLVDAKSIGVAGHSLGGYTALGMVGGWPSWKDSRIRAALLLSPYTLPFTIQDTLKGVTVPLMYQGSDFDLGITPFLEGKNGAYAQSNSPKYFVKLRGGTHFTWTNAVCAGQPTITECLQSKPDAKLIDDYGIAFFDFHLKAKVVPLLTAENSALSNYQFQR